MGWRSSFRGSSPADGGSQPVVTRGAGERTPGRTGFAHLFEHMMFEGSRHVPGSAHFHFLSRGRFGYQRHDRFRPHQLFETLPSNQLELALWLESTAWVICRTSWTGQSFDQQDVVRNERRQSVENAPYGVVEEAMFTRFFPKEHPYYGDVIGSHAESSPPNSKTCGIFFKLYYAPNNASLAIVGDSIPKKRANWCKIFWASEERRGRPQNQSAYAGQSRPSGARWSGQCAAPSRVTWPG